jgi:hypothetical protein
MPWKVKVYTLIEPEEEEIFQDKQEAYQEAEQVNFMQPEGVSNYAQVVECNEKGEEI